MPAFTYTALSSSGQQSTGKLTAGSRAEVFKKLEAQSLTAVKVVEEASAGATQRKAAKDQAAGAFQAVKLKRAQIILFTEEMADLLDGGLQIDQALRVLEERQEAAEVKAVAGMMRIEVREGSTISKALRKASPSFDDLYINMVAAGEASGSLPEILRRLAIGLNVMQELQSKVTQAMIYPVLLILACACLLIVFMTVLVPQLTSLLDKSNVQMPMATVILMNMTGFFKQWWWLMLTVVTAALLIFRAHIQTPKGRMWWDKTKLELPLFGGATRTRIYAQFAHSLGNLVVNGVPLLNGLKLATKAMSNKFVQTGLTSAVALVGEGAPLSNALRKVGQFPSLLTDMIAVGEQTGTLGRALEKSAIRYDKELDKQIKRLTTYISPAIMIFMAVIVGLVAYSIVTAIFQATQGVRNQA